MLKNILSKLLGLDRKEKKEPVEPTPQTRQPSADPPPQPLTPPRDGLNLQNAVVGIPSPGGEGGLSAPTSDFRKCPPEKSAPSVVKLSSPDNSKHETLNFKPEPVPRRLTGKVAKLPR